MKSALEIELEAQIAYYRRRVAALPVYTGKQRYEKLGRARVAVAKGILGYLESTLVKTTARRLVYEQAVRDGVICEQQA